MVLQLPITYLVADDHPVFREGLCNMLDRDAGFRCIGQAGDGANLLQLLTEQQPDAVLLDYSMPRMDGLETLLQVRDRAPGVPVLVITMNNHAYVAHNLIDAGVSGILMKGEADVEDIRAALRSAVETGYYFNEHLNHRILASFAAERMRGKRPLHQSQLNERDIEVLRYVCDGLTPEEIGKQIFTSPRTVERIRTGLLQKTGARNTIGLVVFAMQTGLYPAAGG